MPEQLLLLGGVFKLGWRIVRLELLLPEFGVPSSSSWLVPVHISVPGQLSVPPAEHVCVLVLVCGLRRGFLRLGL